MDNSSVLCGRARLRSAAVLNWRAVDTRSGAQSARSQSSSIFIRNAVSQIRVARAAAPCALGVKGVRVESLAA
jgi:hypothetical protein